MFTTLITIYLTGVVAITVENLDMSDRVTPPEEAEIDFPELGAIIANAAMWPLHLCKVVGRRIR